MSNSIYRDSKEEYTEKRERLRVADYHNWFYTRLPMTTFFLSDLEGKLSNKMKKIRDQYKENFMYRREAFPPAEPFYKAKEAIQNCPLYEKVFKGMPKGGLLHVHSAAGLSVEGLINLLLDICKRNDDFNVPTLYITPDVVEIDGKRKFAEYTLLYEHDVEENNLTQYVKPLKDYLYNSEDIKNLENIETLKEYLSFASARVEDIPYIWDEFNTIFSRTSFLFTNETFYFVYHCRFFEECLDDSIDYIELRCGFETFAKGMVSKVLKLKSYDYRQFLRHKDSLLEVNLMNLQTDFLDKLMRAKEEVNRFIMAEGRTLNIKVILCARRALNAANSIERNKLLEKMDAAILIKNMPLYRDLVIGFDFVSEEDRGYATENYADIIYDTVLAGYKDLNPEELEKWNEVFDVVSTDRNYIDKYGELKTRIQLINFFLHDGESNWNDNDNVLAAAIISRYRIGHGFNLNKHPGCLKGIVGEVLEEKVLVEPVLEICPISNQLLRYYPDLRNHSAFELMRQGIVCCIANDDPQILGNPGLSYDFWEAYVGMELPFEVVKGLVFVAYLYQFYDYKTGVCDVLGAEIKFEKEWKAFVKRAYQELSSR